ncbi:MAG: exodeoxyribonuclease VII large subunit [Pseudomonadota bacterium]
MSALAPGPETRVYQPGELNAEVRLHLEAGFPRLWLAGEVSNLARPASGHWYFTIKDARAQIRCALFRPRRNQIGFEPANGDQVLLRGRLSLYEPRGDYQLIADTLLPAGSGALQQAFAALKSKLEKEGLFASERKKTLPQYPQRIAIVTSPTGAAIRDMLVTLKRRWPVANVRIYATPVQGDQAVEGLIKALRAVDRNEFADVILLGRGGGSLEDLQAFNDEALARVIADINTPIVTGIGHETDVSIADWVADVRAATPTAAAEAATPDGTAIRQRLDDGNQRMSRTLNQQHQRRWQQLDAIERRRKLQHPARRLIDIRTRLEALEKGIWLALDRRMAQTRQSLEYQTRRLQNCHPARALQQSAQQQAQLEQRLTRAMGQSLIQSSQRLTETARALNAISPLAVLGRGYAVIENESGRALTRIDDFETGQTIQARLSQFSVTAQVLSVQASETQDRINPETNE